MNTSIRKDSKVSTHTTNNVVVIGTVTSVRGSHLIIQTPSGVEHDVLKVNSIKLSTAEFKAAVLEATQPNVAVKPEVKADVKVAVKPEVKADVKADVKAEIKKQVKKEVAKEVAKVNKKALALEIFAKHKGAKRKVIIAEFKENGMSAACASTYYQNIKSGTWS